MSQGYAGQSLLSLDGIRLALYSLGVNTLISGKREIR